MEDSSPRLFYALWPDPDTARRLGGLQKSVQGRKTHIEDLHLTLAFLGNQPGDRLPLFERILSGLDLPALTLRIDTLGHFPNVGIAWAGMTHAPPALAALQEALVQALRAAGVPLRDGGRFRPHITLARAAGRPAAFEGEPIIWQARTLALAASEAGGETRYRIVSSRSGVHV